MSGPYEQFSARIAEAADDAAFHALLGEIGLWRATRLMDIRAQREAAYALSVIYKRLGQQQSAAHEAEQLSALCRTPPEAGKDELKFVRRHVGEITGRGRREKRAREPQEKAPKRTQREARPAKKPEGEKVDRRAAFDDALGHGRQGKWDAAREALAASKGRGKPSTRQELFALWIDLSEALGQTGDAREKAIAGVEKGLRDRFYASEAPTDGGALAAVLGKGVPRGRQALVDALAAHLDAKPDEADALAAAALEDHVARRGDRKTAPWLFSIVARAMALSDATATKAAIAKLSEQGAYAVTAYSEGPFGMIVDVVRGVQQAGGRVTSVRRGVERRLESDDRRLWTLRARLDGADFFVVAGEEATTAYDDETAAKLAKRVIELGSGAFVIAPGVGYAGFRAGAMALGAKVFDRLDVGAVVEAMRTEAPSRPAPVETPEVEAKPAEAPAASEAPKAEKREPKKPSAVGEAIRLFQGEATPTTDDFVTILKDVRRASVLFAPVRRSLSELSADEADTRVFALLQAMNQTVPEGIGLPAAVDVAVHVAAGAPDGKVAGYVSEGGDGATRFGGIGLRGLLDLARTAVQQGWLVDRVLKGVLRSEARRNAALGALQADLGGLWRVILTKDGSTPVELWWLTDLTPEGQVAVPLIPLRDDRVRVVVTADEEGRSWFATLDAGAALLPGELGDALAGPAADSSDEAAPVEAAPEEAAEASDAPAS